MSGKLNGTRTLASELESIENPDEIEEFLKEFIHVTFDLPEENRVMVVKTKKEVSAVMHELKSRVAVSVFADNAFQKLYITTKEKVTYILEMEDENLHEISSFISSEKSMKYVLNGFALMKWCNSKSIEPKNVIDLLVSMKLLTGEVDPSVSVQDYLKKYCHQENISEEKSMVMAGNFVLQFGEYLSRKLESFQLSAVGKIVNENFYYEGIPQPEEEDLCKIRFSYVELEEFFAENKIEFLKKYENKAYMKSPLGRIALKFGHNVAELAQELCKDDIEIKILNELFSNNIRVTVLAENYYEVACKYKNFSSVISLITAIMKDTFFTLFERKIDVKMECLVKS